jgi:ABC-type dipeptide/oligopeptide/nickel transport system permease component
MLIKIFIIAVLITIVVSLGSGLFYLVRDKGQSDRTVKALSWRIGISFSLFLLLIILTLTGVIKPHGVFPTASSSNASQSTD